MMTSIRKSLNAIASSLLLLSCNSQAAAEKNLEGFYVGFEVETIAGYNKQTIREYGCKALVNYNKLRRSLKYIPKNNEFQKGHLKLLVINYDGSELQIDANGFGVHGEKFVHGEPDQIKKSIEVIDQRCR